MGLMTPGKIAEKYCKVQRLDLSEFLFGFLSFFKPRCEGPQCAHWNYTDKVVSIGENDIKKDGTFEPTNEGYCGISPPLDELNVLNLNNQGL